MCLSKEYFHYVNRNSQLSLFSFCSGICESIVNITWNIYQGSMNSSNKTIQWTLFPPMISSWFFGKYSFE
jgi:hypothetical protein